VGGGEGVASRYQLWGDVVVISGGGESEVKRMGVGGQEGVERVLGGVELG